MENNKEELKKLEIKYNKYMKYVKTILLIIIITILILLIRYCYVFSLMYKITKANHSDKSKTNCKITYSYIYENDENNSSVIIYCKDSVSVMKVEGFFSDYVIDNKRYSLYDTENGKTYSINDYDNRNFETITSWERLLFVFNQTNSCFTSNISYKDLNGEQFIVLSENNEENWYNSNSFMLVRKINENCILNITYEYDIVTNNDTQLPDLSEYQLIEEN